MTLSQEMLEGQCIKNNIVRRHLQPAQSYSKDALNNGYIWNKTETKQFHWNKTLFCVCFVPVLFQFYFRKKVICTPLSLSVYVTCVCFLCYICVFMLYFHFTSKLYGFACTSDTCLIKDQSVSQMLVRATNDNTSQRKNLVDRKMFKSNI